MSLTDTLKQEVTEIEFRQDMSVEEKISRITHITCTTCSLLATQPLPFADIFILTPIQAYMGTRIAAIRGMPVQEEEVTDLIKEIAGVVGMGVIAQQTAIGLFKTILPWLGGLMTVPLVYGLSFAIMRVIDVWYEAKSRGATLTAEDIKKIWRTAREEGKSQGQQNQNGR